MFRAEAQMTTKQLLAVKLLDSSKDHEFYGRALGLPACSRFDDLRYALNLLSEDALLILIRLSTGSAWEPFHREPGTKTTQTPLHFTSISSGSPTPAQTPMPPSTPAQTPMPPSTPAQALSTPVQAPLPAQASSTQVQAPLPAQARAPLTSAQTLPAPAPISINRPPPLVHCEADLRYQYYADLHYQDLTTMRVQFLRRWGSCTKKQRRACANALGLAHPRDVPGAVAVARTEIMDRLLACVCTDFDVE